MAKVATVPAERLVWVDAARGVSVLLVVLFHIVLWHLGEYHGQLWEPAGRIWTKFNAVLGSARMPLLLGVSGLVTSRRLRVGFRDRRNLVGAATSYYLYVVWLLLYAAFFAFVSTPRLPHRIDGIDDIIFQFVFPDTTLWFLWALAFYSVVVPALHRVPGLLQLMLFAVLCVVSRSMDIEAGLTLKFAENAFFFVVGVHASLYLRRLAEDSTVLRTLAAALVAAVVTLGGRVMTGDVLGSILFMARGLAFLVLAVLSISVLVRWHVIGRALSSIGQQTLPIYVFHPLMIYLVMTLTREDEAFSGALATPAVAMLYPVALLACMAVLSLLLHKVLIRIRLGWLFQMPLNWRSRILADE